MQSIHCGIAINMYMIVTLNQLTGGVLCTLPKEFIQVERVVVELKKKFQCRAKSRGRSHTNHVTVVFDNEFLVKFGLLSGDFRV